MLSQASAQALRDRLAPLTPRNEVTAVPWDGEDGEWVVTVHDTDGTPVADVFRVESAYAVRRIGGGPVVGTTESEPQIPVLARLAARA